MNIGKIEFKSKEIVCRGDFYISENYNGKIIVMGHGFAAERGFSLDKFVLPFCESGFNVLLFDYRCFGDSDGDISQLVSIRMRIEDWESAVQYAKTRSKENKNIILWGLALSAGHAINLAAKDEDIIGIIATTPLVSGLGAVLNMRIFSVLRLTCHGVLDIAKRLFGLSPHRIPMVSKDDKLCILANSYDDYMSLITDPKSTWKNAVPASIVLELPFYNPTLVASKVKCPALLIGGTNDELAPCHYARKVASKMPKGEYIELECNHFEPITGDAFSETLTHQLKFLDSIVSIKTT
jgi:pimeloyl-ACP methyl ester carboxylesterase